MDKSESESNVKVVTVSELLRRNRPLSGTSSLLSSSSSPSTPSRRGDSISRPPARKSPVAPDFTSPNPNPKVLVPLNYPAILIGVLNLPTYGDSSSSSSSFVCSKGNCFVFSDGLSALCCDIIDFDVRIVGREIVVSSWNFIPFKHNAGFLEVIKWRFLDSDCLMRSCSSVDSFPFKHDGGSTPDPCKEDLKAHYCVHGVVESVSPVLVVPCTGGGNSQNGGGSSKLRGYLVEIMACECKLCKVKISEPGLHNSVNVKITDGHCFNKPKVIYFCGFASSWHPVMTKLVGTVVLLSGLKKKLVFFGNDGSKLMYIITQKSLLHMPPGLLNRHLPSEKTPINGRGESAAYTGIVKGIYMQGMVVELDKDVWLLLTDQVLTPPHSLRVGSLISVKNVHFVNPKFSWTKVLLLGACSKTSITVEIFSPLQTGAHVVLSSQSLLMKYIDSLAFSARLWVFLVVSCFRKKFAGFLSEQEIYGSKHKEGLVQMYAGSKLPSSVLQTRQGSFMAFCRHEISGCCNNLNNVHPQLVLPLSSFVSHAKVSCTGTILPFGKDLEMMCDTNQVSTLSCNERSYSQSLRGMLSNENRNIVMLGCLKISPSSGKLQIVDASGGIDVLIPDLPSFWNADSIYEVNNYELVVQGIPEQAVQSCLSVTEPLSCRHIFQNFPIVNQANSAAYALFHLQSSTSNNQVIYRSIVPKDNFEKPLSGTFQLLRVTHKFPLLQKFEGDPVITSMPNTFAEAIFLPWVLFLNGKDMDTHQTNGRRDDQDHAPRKRHKIDHASSDRMLKERCSSLQECWSRTASLKVPCSATSTIHRSDCMVSSGFLCYTKANQRFSLGSKSNVERVLLEFKSESYVKYQLLQIGGYYITECSKEDLCKPKGLKFVVTLETYLWSLSFSPSEMSSFIDPLDNALLFEPCVNRNRVNPEDPKLLLKRLTCIDGPFQDVNGNSSANVILKIECKFVDEDLINIAMTEKEADGASQCVDTTITSSQPSGTVESGCGLPVGNLISLNGHVVSLHNSDYTSFDDHISHENRIYLQHLRNTQARRSIVCIYLAMDHHIVRIFVGLSKPTYPVGFGPDVDATFYRILQLGQNDFLLTPVSYIVINTIRVVNSGPTHNNSSLLIAPDLCKTLLPYTVSSGLISDMIQCSDCMPISFCSRVVAIHVLVLEKKSKNHDDPQQTSNSKLSVNIPLAGFILDDGSTVCCCWASDERAAIFLGLSEDIIPKTLEIKRFTMTGNGRNKPRRTSIHHVEKVLEKHHRITVKNHGSIFDSSYQDLIFSVSSDDVLGSADGNLFKSVIFNACFGTILSCQGKVMDSNAARAIEKHLIEMEMPMLSMPNIWIEDAGHRNTLAEARNMIDELQNR